jgi:hypothetical protein
MSTIPQGYTELGAVARSLGLSTNALELLVRKLHLRAVAIGAGIFALSPTVLSRLATHLAGAPKLHQRKSSKKHLAALRRRANARSNSGGKRSGALAPAQQQHVRAKARAASGAVQCSNALRPPFAVSNPIADEPAKPSEIQSLLEKFSNPYSPRPHMRPPQGKPPSKESEIRRLKRAKRRERAKRAELERWQKGGPGRMLKTPRRRGPFFHTFFGTLEPTYPDS